MSMSFFDYVLGNTPNLPKPEKTKPKGFWAGSARGTAFNSKLDNYLQIIKNNQHDASPLGTMDNDEIGMPSFKLNAGFSRNSTSSGVIDFFASQSFIGYQVAGILAQHWLIDKVCSLPGDDAVRNGYRVVSFFGDAIEPDVAKIYQTIDHKFRVKQHCREFLRKGRIFGVRIAMFKVDSADPLYYEKPFNIDGVGGGCYKGIVQIDPYWCAPILVGANASEATSLHFYEPEFWQINGKKIHRSHLIIFRHSQPIDVLKPLYQYGGIPLPQQIMERIYAAERTANEAPQLAMTKRTRVWLTDMELATMDMNATERRLQEWSEFGDNYGVFLGDKETDELTQTDISLADLDAVIMTEYQLVAAMSNVPASKMLGITPKGFNSSGDYEQESYREFLETTRENELTPLLERHHELVHKSYVLPKFPDLADLKTTIEWASLDTPSDKEQAEISLLKAQTDVQLAQIGAIDGMDVRKRLAGDLTSGYNELDLDAPAPELELSDQTAQNDDQQLLNGQA